jgi:hypothetical protein
MLSMTLWEEILFRGNEENHEKPFSNTLSCFKCIETYLNSKICLKLVEKRCYANYDQHFLAF